MTNTALKEQREEKELREERAREHGYTDPEKILRAVSCHHCIPVMSKKARDYRVKFDKSDWILDVGSGTGYYWRNTGGGNLILMDFALTNLKAARTLLRGQKNVFFVQADAASLPFKSETLSGIWSVQVTQHFSDPVMRSFLSDARRVLKKRFLAEIYNLNPAILHKILYKILGKSFHLKGKAGNMILNRLSANELVAIWRSLAVSANFRLGYSELFFHPDLHFRPNGKLAGSVEDIFGGITHLSRLFSRQVQIKISSGFAKKEIKI